jgi:phage terminase small subunit
MTNDTQFGPKMRLLTERQRAFVIAFVEAGNQNYAEAYKIAGYAKDDTGGNASRLANSPKIQGAILEETSSRLHAMAPVALATVLKIATTDNHPAQFAAAKHILAATGFNQRQSIDVNHGGTVEIGFSELMAQLQQLRSAGIERLPSPIVIDLEPDDGRS